MSLGMSEILLILVVILLLFGSKRIPELAKSLGRAAGEYKKAKEMFKKEADEIADMDKEKPVEYQIKDDSNNPEI